MKTNKNFYVRDTCRLCGSKNLENVLPLTPTALCDAYVAADRLKEPQDIYPLELFLCLDCGYAHLPYVVDPKIIYLDYIYVTTSSLGLVDHFKKYADRVVSHIKPREDSQVVDIGSNDGTLLGFFKNHGMRVLGIEPAKVIAQEATARGIETIPEFFNVDLAQKIKNKYGQSVIITINNLFANIDDLEELAKSISILLAPGGFLIIESSYLGDMIKNMVFDFIYHEHLSYLSVRPLIKFFRRFNMELIDVERVPTKGGSLRYYFQLNGALGDVLSSVKEIAAYEEKIGLGRPEIFKSFREKIDSLKSQLNNQLKQLKRQNKTIAGYGGSATTTTLLYHFGLEKTLDYIIDDNPAKQNTFSPGYHIPVLPPRVLYQRNPEYILILAWRYAQDIMKKHDDFLRHGGHFIIPLPEIKIV